MKRNIWGKRNIFRFVSFVLLMAMLVEMNEISALGEEVLVEEVLAEEASVEEVLAEEASVEEVLAEEASVEEVLAEEALAEEVLAEEASIEEAVIEDNADTSEAVISDCLDSGIIDDDIATVVVYDIEGDDYITEGDDYTSEGDDYIVEDDISDEVVGDNGTSIGYVYKHGTVPADAKEFNAGDFKYVKMDNGNYVVTAYLGSDSTVTIPSTLFGDSVTIIGRRFVYNSPNFSNVTELIIPSQIVEIGEWAFRDSNIETITFKSTVISDAYIGKRVVTSLRDIGSDAFNHCEKLTSVNLSASGLVTLGERVFYQCYALEEIYLPETLKKVDNFCFTSCSISRIYYVGTLAKYTEIDFGTSATPNSSSYMILCDFYTAKFKNGELVTEKVLEPNFTGAKTISEYLFQNITFTDITIGSTVETIGQYAFFHCGSLVSVDMSTCKVTKIPKSCFNDCRSLADVKLPADLICIDESAFSANYDLDTIVFPNKLERIENAAFSGVSFSECTVPASLQYIGRYGFYVSGTLKYDGNIYTWMNIDYYDADTKRLNELASSILFKNGDSYEAVVKLVIPDNVSKIAYKQFLGFGELKELRFGSNIKSIGQYAFGYGTNLSNSNYKLDAIYFDGTVSDWARLADAGAYMPNMFTSNIYFKGEKVTEIILDEDIIAIKGNTFYNFKDVVKADLSNVVNIGDYAFGACRKLNELTLSEDLVDIGLSAFWWSGVTSVKIGESVTQFNNQVFGSCLLTELYLPKSLTYIHNTAFALGKGAKVYVYKGSYADEYVQKLIEKYKKDYPNYTYEIIYRDEVEQEVEKFEGCSAIYDENIGMRFYYTFSDEILNDENAFVRITYPTGEGSKNLDIKIKDGKAYSNQLIYTVNYAPKDIDSRITAQLHYGNGKTGKLITTSYLSYCEKVIDTIPLTNGGEESIYVKECKALLRYCNEVQNCLDYHKGSIPAKYLADIDYLADEDYSEYEPSIIGAKFGGVSLLLGDTISVRIYVCSTETHYAFGYEKYGLMVGDDANSEDGYGMVTIEDGYLVATIPQQYLVGSNGFDLNGIIKFSSGSSNINSSSYENYVRYEGYGIYSVIYFAALYGYDDIKKLGDAVNHLTKVTSEYNSKVDYIIGVEE